MIYFIERIKGPQHSRRDGSCEVATLIGSVAKYWQVLEAWITFPISQSSTAPVSTSFGVWLGGHATFDTFGVQQEKIMDGDVRVCVLT